LLAHPLKKRLDKKTRAEVGIHENGVCLATDICGASGSSRSKLIDFVTTTASNQRDAPPRESQRKEKMGSGEGGVREHRECRTAAIR
jgi:hypothetical protein